MQCCIGAFAALGLMAPGASAADVPEVTRLLELVEQQQKAATTTWTQSNLAKALAEPVAKRVRALATSWGIAEPAKTNDKAFEAFVLSRWRRRVSKAWVDKARATRMFALVRRATTDAAAVDALSAWLGIVSLEPSVVPENVLISDQVTTHPVTGDLRLAPESMRVLAEVGGAGQGNSEPRTGIRWAAEHASRWCGRV